MLHRIRSNKYYVLFAVLVVSALPAFAQTAVPTDPVTLTVDINPLFTSINVYIPMFLAIFAIAGGIAIAIAIVQMVIKSVTDAVKSRS